VGVVGTPDELFVLLQELRLQIRTWQRITRRHLTIPETVPTMSMGAILVKAQQVGCLPDDEGTSFSIYIIMHVYGFSLVKLKLMEMVRTLSLD
jgi:hypothetical protein